MDKDTHTYTKNPKQPPQTSYICLPWRSLAAGIPEQSTKLFDLGDQCSESHKGHCATVPEILELHRAKVFIYETCFVSPLLKEWGVYIAQWHLRHVMSALETSPTAGALYPVESPFRAFSEIKKRKAQRTRLESEMVEIREIKMCLGRNAPLRRCSVTSVLESSAETSRLD